MIAKRMMRLSSIVLSFAFLMVVNGCKVDRVPEKYSGAEAPPFLLECYPASVDVNSGSFVLYVCGRDFTERTKIYVGDQQKETEFILPSKISCIINPEDLAIGESQKFINIQLANLPAREDCFSNTIPLHIEKGEYGFAEPVLLIDVDEDEFLNDIHSIIYQDHIFITYSQLHMHQSGYTYDQGDIFLIKSEDQGKTWQPARNLSKTNTISESPSMTMDDEGVLYLIYKDGPEANKQIFITKSFNLGINWTKRKPLPIGENDKVGCCIKSLGCTLYLAGCDQDSLHIYSSNDHGNNWIKNKAYANAWNDSDKCNEMAFSVRRNGRIDLIWVFKGLMRYGYRMNDGVAWSVPEPVDYFKPLLCRGFLVAGANNGDVFILWRDEYSSHQFGTQRYVYFCRSFDNGITWDSPFKFAEIYPNSYFAMDLIPASEGHLLMRVDYYSLYSTDNGVTWSAPLFTDYRSTIESICFHKPDNQSAGDFHIVLNQDQQYYYSKMVKGK